MVYWCKLCCFKNLETDLFSCIWDTKPPIKEFSIKILETKEEFKYKVTQLGNKWVIVTD